jgi:protein-S-isoprenylcysteine O-methyltransferase Ste14
MSEKDHPNIHRNIHPPIIAFIFITFAYLLGWLIRIPLNATVMVRNLGFGLVVIGFLFGAGAFLEFRKARTTLDPHGSAKQLVTAGIYQITRNPIYLGFLLMVIGLPLNSGIYWGILLSPIYAITMDRLVIAREEAYLEMKFKDQYKDYQSHVRRWL